MPKTVELRQERTLIKKNFDGYKLSLEPLPISTEDLNSPPIKASPSDEQYSLLHAELFSKQNLLALDPWHRVSSYFINQLGEIIRTDYDKQSGSGKPSKAVFRLDKIEREPGDYNFSMKLISEKYCLLCDGHNELLLLETGNRLEGEDWKRVTSVTISTDQKHFLLCDGRIDIVGNNEIISCALVRIVRRETNYTHLLHWGRFTRKKDNELWKFSIIDNIEGKGSLYYCSFEPGAQSIILSSNRKLWFHTKEGRQPEDCSSETTRRQFQKDSPELYTFTWYQNNEDVIINFNAHEGKVKSDYKIKCTEDILTVKCCEEVLLDKELFEKVDQDLTTWTIENNFVQVNLVKKTVSVRWDTIFVDGEGPKESKDKSSTIPMEKRPVVNLEVPAEDCDFPMGSLDDENKIERFDLSYQEPTHQILLTNTPPLFYTTIKAGLPPAVVTRQDVDACIWLQQFDVNNPQEFSFRHEGNLHAFGYVQASKQKKKFIDCSPDLSYAVIVESHKHMFLYKSNHDSVDGLRNRTGSQVTMGKQHLVELKDIGEVLGITTDKDVVILLTEKCILHLNIN